MSALPLGAFHKASEITMYLSTVNKKAEKNECSRRELGVYDKLQKERSA